MQMATAPVAAVLARADFFRDLPEDQLECLATAALRRRYRPREAIARTGDPADRLHIVESGFVKIILELPTGAERVIDVLGPGHCLGAVGTAPVSGDRPRRTCLAQALDTVQTVSVPIDVVHQLIQVNPCLKDQALVMLATQVGTLRELIRQMSVPSLASRVATLLINLATRYGREADGRIEIDVPLVQQDLAAMIGTSRSTVNQWLGWFEGHGAISRRGRHITILDLEFLRARVL
jgi:CRP-like cAMP-binding protein